MQRYRQGDKTLAHGFSKDFQTPEIVADFMAQFLPDNCGTILEPTPGIGNLARSGESED